MTRRGGVLSANAEAMSVGGLDGSACSRSPHARCMSPCTRHNTAPMRRADHRPRTGARGGRRSAVAPRRELAAELGALEAFAAGLHLLPAGAVLAHRLGLPARWSVDADLRASSAPGAALTVDRLVGRREPEGAARDRLAKAATAARVHPPLGPPRGSEPRRAPTSLRSAPVVAAARHAESVSAWRRAREAVRRGSPAGGAEEGRSLVRTLLPPRGRCTSSRRSPRGSSQQHLPCARRLRAPRMHPDVTQPRFPGRCGSRPPTTSTCSPWCRPLTSTLPHRSWAPSSRRTTRPRTPRPAPQPSRSAAPRKQHRPPAQA